MINVVNLIDGVDGLAAGVCVISAITLAIVAVSLDRTSAAVLAALTAGGALGFLRHGFPPGVELHGRHGLEPARLPARRDRGPGGAEDERRRRPLLPPGRTRGADPRHRLRDREADQVPPADLPGRPLALPSPDGEHRLLPAPHPRLPVRLGAGDGRARAGAALRPLLRRSRQLRPLVDGGDRRLLGGRRSRRASTSSSRSRSSSCARRASGSCSAPGAPRRRTRRSTRASPASSRPAASRPSIPRRASSRSSIPPRRGPRGRSSDCYKRVTSAPAERPVFLYSRRRRRVLALFRDGRLSLPGIRSCAHCLAATSTSPMTETPRRGRTPPRRPIPVAATTHGGRRVRLGSRWRLRSGPGWALRGPRRGYCSCLRSL